MESNSKSEAPKQSTNTPIIIHSTIETFEGSIRQSLDYTRDERYLPEVISAYDVEAIPCMLMRDTLT